ncbi:MAG: hypothetical protein R2852_08585 [Bacteroidia bacterium]
MQRISLTLILSIVSFSIFAQNGKDTVTNRSVVLENVYKPKFLDVQKIESVPVLDKPAIKPVSFTYKITPFQVTTEKIVNPIPVLDLNVKDENVYPNSFVKLGYGNIRTPLAEIYLNNKQNTKYSYGAHYRFLQSNSDLNNSFADFTTHNFKGYANTFTEIGEVGVDLNYNQNRFNFYGYNTLDTNLEASKDNLGRTINSFDARAYFNSTSSNSKKLKHRTQFNFYNYRVGKATENQYALSSKLYKKLRNTGEMKDAQISTVLGVDYNIFDFDTLKTIKRFFIQFDPRFDFVYDGLILSVGFNTTLFFKGGDTITPFINPVIKATYPIVEGVANLYAGIDGRYQKQSLRNIVNTNPYTTQYSLLNRYENVSTFLGLNAKIGSSADAVFEIGYSDVSNMPLYISNGDSLNSFSILYRQVSVLKFTTAFNYSFSEKVRIGVLGNFYNYEVTAEPYPWQLPNIDGKLNMQFNIKNKIYPYIDIIAMGVQKQRTGRGSNYSNSSIEAFYDLSAGIDYRFKKKLSAFVQANNMLSSRYQRWYNYPVYGFNIIGGITMIF